MLKPLMLFVIGLFFGTGLGVVLAASNGVTLAGHDHADPTQHVGHGPAESAAEGMHAHALHDVAGEGAPPTVALRVHPETGRALNLEIVADNFAFAPEHAGMAHVPGEGHAHVYVDGVKVARVYGPWFHLDDVPPGAEISVTLNANSHETLAIGATPIGAAVRAPAG